MTIDTLKAMVTNMESYNDSLNDKSRSIREEKQPLPKNSLADRLRRAKLAIKLGKVELYRYGRLMGATMEEIEYSIFRLARYANFASAKFFLEKYQALVNNAVLDAYQPI